MSQFHPLSNSINSSQRVPRAAGIAVVVLGLSVLLGWLLDNRMLMSIVSGSVAMKANTAIGFVLAGLALLAVAASPAEAESAFYRRAALLASLLVVLISGATGAEYLFGWDLYIDELFFRDVVHGGHLYYPGRMSPISAFNFLCVGGALIGLARRGPPLLIQILAGCSAFATLIVVVGTSYGVASLSVGGRSVAVSLHASAGFAMLCIGIVYATGNGGIVRFFNDRGAVGTVMRRLLPAAILVPALIGWLRLWGEDHHLFSTQVGISILSIANIVSFTGMVAWSVRSLVLGENEKRRAENALQESHQRYTFLADAMPEIVWTARPDGGLDYYNKAWYEYTGMTFEQTRDWGWEPVVHPEDLPQCVQRWTNSFTTGTDYEVEYRFKRASDGAYRWHLGRATPQRNLAGEITHWVGTCTDIDDRKRAEEELARRVEDRTAELSRTVERLHEQVRERERAEHSNQLIMENSLDVICTIDESGHFIRVSHACEGLWGYRAEELVGRLYMDFVHSDDHAETSRAAVAIMAGTAFPDFENSYVRKDGSRIPIVWTANWSASEKTMFCVARDVSERKRIEGELQAAKEAAETANRFKSRFLANMSHEIRTPMNGVIGMTDLLLDTPLQQNQREYTQTIRSCGENLLHVINDILDFSKIEAGKLVIEQHDFNLHDLLEDTLELLAATAHAKEIELAGMSEPAVPNRLRGDSVRLRQILINLVGNGIKFTARGAVSVRVELASETDDAATLIFRVCDSGLGISAEAQRSLFQAFSQADASTTRCFGGTGLGLAICKQLVESMGGEIGVQSEPGHGATFWFSLPLKKQPSDHRPSRSDHAFAGVRVLVAEEHTISATFLCRQLDSLKMSSTHVRSGPEALDHLQRAAIQGRPFSFAIIALGMSEMDGLTLARAIKSSPSLAPTRLILLTTHGSQPSASDLQEAGIDQCKVKPVRQSTLYDCLATSMNEGTPSPSPTLSVASVTPSPERILVADDNAVNRMLALAQFAKLGYVCDAVTDGMQAMEALGKIPYDLVFMDCQMPRMDGFEATRLIRANEAPGQPTWIVAMTANAMSGDREECLAAGMNDYVSKPVHLDDLRAAIKRARMAKITSKGGVLPAQELSGSADANG
ncbi:MAG: rpfC [Chthoniobacteraceae bacterium]|nr:rpfC [Chthoniobacteraceae bacterium]